MNEKRRIGKQTHRNHGESCTLQRSGAEKRGMHRPVVDQKSLRDIIGDIYKRTDIATAANFLDDIKQLGFMHGLPGGLSFNLGDVIIPAEKEES